MAEAPPTPHAHLLIMAGLAPTPDVTWTACIDIINALNGASPIAALDTYLNVSPHSTLSDLKQVKSLGVRQVQYNLEVFDAGLYARICPAKMPFEAFLARIEEAVNVMGRGRVRSNFVLGLQPIADLLKGVEYLARRGIVADYSVFQPKRGTPLAAEAPPSMDDVVSFSRELAGIYDTNGFSPLYCSMSSRSSIVHELMATPS